MITQPTGLHNCFCFLYASNLQATDHSIYVVNYGFAQSSPEFYLKGAIQLSTFNYNKDAYIIITRKHTHIYTYIYIYIYIYVCVLARNNIYIYIYIYI